MMPDTQRLLRINDAGPHSAESVISAADSARTDERGFGLTLFLLSALSMVTVVALAVMVDWRGGLAMFLAATLMLALFLRWEMRRHTRQRQTVLATQAQVNLITETSPL
jgi:hypothetical protein